MRSPSRSRTRGRRPPPRAARHRPETRASTDPRFSRRQRAVRRERRRKAIARTCGVLVVLAAAWAVFYSPLLKVRHIEVVGAERTAPSAVTSAADVDSGANLLFIDNAEIAGRVRSLPWVQSVDVDRMLPGTIRIGIVERKPSLVLSLGAARWTIDDRGRVLEAGDAAGGLPVLAGVAVATVRPGVELRTPEATAALAVWRSLSGHLKGQVVAILAPTVERIALTLQDGTLVRYGAPERTAGKGEVLEALLKRMRSEGSGAAYIIDVRAPAHPAVSIEAPDGAVPPPDDPAID
jgi:cell division protein FtsQ